MRYRPKPRGRTFEPLLASCSQSLIVARHRYQIPTDIKFVCPIVALPADWRDVPTLVNTVHLLHMRSNQISVATAKYAADAFRGTGFLLPVIQPG